MLAEFSTLSDVELYPLVQLDMSDRSIKIRLSFKVRCVQYNLMHNTCRFKKRKKIIFFCTPSILTLPSLVLDRKLQGITFLSFYNKWWSDVALIIKYHYHDTDDNKVNKIDVIENSSIILPASMFEHYTRWLPTLYPPL